jgi:hypothetical protein
MDARVSGGDQMNGLTRQLTLGAAVALALTLAGCGSAGTTSPKSSGTASSHAVTSPATNGLENQTAAKVTQAAGAALKAAKTVHVRGTFLTNTGTEKFDLRYQGGSTSGTFTVHGVTIHLITVGGKAYLKASKHGWAIMGNPPDSQSMLAGKWVRTGTAREMLTPFSLATFASELSAEEYAQGGSVAQATLAGQKVVVVTYPDGSKLYVATAGTAYPLRFENTSSIGGRRDFSEYGAEFHIATPDGVLNLGSG